MKRIERFFFRIILIVTFGSIITMGLYPCSTISLQSGNDIVVANNFDFIGGMGHVSVNYPNVSKKAITYVPENQLSWVSKYGSVTFNQLGKELPLGGMNEKGLVITVMRLDQTIYPAKDDRFALSEVQWVQYQLDNFSTVGQVLASESRIRITYHSVGKIHFYVSDSTGKTAVIEYLDCERKVYQDKNLPYPVLTNDTYEKSVDYAKQFQKKGTFYSLPAENASLHRFVRAAAMASEWSGKRDKSNPVNYAYKILDNVSQTKYTQWSIVYDIKNRTIYYKTKQNKAIRTINLNVFDFSAGSAGLYLHIDANHNGKLSDFLPFNIKENRRLFESAFRAIPYYQKIPPALQERIIQYPLTTELVE